MWFDLTREAQLPEKNYRIYKRLQVALYVIAFLLVTIMSIRIIFAAQNFSFSFTNPDSTKNNIIAPRYQSMNSLVTDGKITTGKELYFDTALIGIYSKAVVEFSQSSASKTLNSGSISVRKSYQAFLYPEGQPIGFKDGTLLKNSNAYYIVSDGQLRKFEMNAFSALGYAPEAFTEISSDELQYNPLGQVVKISDGYPNYSLFKIGGDYYLLKDLQLKKFSSEQAFLSQYKPAQAIEKDASIFAKYPVSGDIISFSDGSIISYGDSVYITSGGKILPVNDPETFIEKGYNWNDVIAASSDEVALYQKTALFTIKGVHPDGTIFKTDESGKYYIIENSEKHLLSSPNIINSWLNHSPIPVSEKSLEITSRCDIQKTSSGYSCEIPIDSLQGLDGAGYEFIMTLTNNTKIDSLNVSFQKNISRANLKSFLINIYNRIKSKYVPQNTVPLQ